MDTFQEIFGIVILFLLRLVVPVLIMWLAGSWLKRLDAKWEAEARTRRQIQSHQAPIQPQSQPQTNPPPLPQPCWEIRQCADTVKVACPAYQNPSLVCWRVFRDAVGHIPEKCLSCAVFAGRQSVDYLN